MKAGIRENIQGFSESAKLELVVDALTDHAIYMLDPDGFVRSWNAGATRITGYQSTEIIGQHYSRFFTESDQANGTPNRGLKEAAALGRFEAEGWRVRKDGTRFWANSVIGPIFGEGRELVGFVKITRDITERKLAQQALLESDRRFRLLVQAVTDYAICMLDPNGIVVEWNAGAERMTGYSAAEIIGHHFSRFYSPQDRVSGLPVRVLETASREGRYEAEGWRVRKDGSRFWASVVIDLIKGESGRVLGFAKITRDITERRAGQDALRDSERQFRLMVECVTDYALFMLDPNGIITSWNRGAERIKGYSADEIIGQHFSKFYTEQDRSAGNPARALYKSATEGHFEAEGWRVRKDGTRFWANVVIDPIHDERGVLLGFAKITRDITERLTTQRALQRVQAERARAQKIEVLGRLTSGVAHDFNNLLMIVTGHLQTLKRLASNDPKGVRAAEAIDSASRRGQSLTRQLLTFSRRQVFNPIVVDIAPQLETLLKMLESSIGVSHKLLSVVPPETWPVKIDVDELELAMMNLALNAKDAMPSGGVITLSATNAHLDAEDAPDGLSGDFVALTVSDTGCGIPEDVLPKIFDPFFTTKQAGRGTGLGLAQVHGFALQSGGSVGVTSKLGQGTSITLYLPRATTTPERDRADSTALVPEGGTALVVEDNPDVLDATVALVEQLGFQVKIAQNAAAALNAVARGDISIVLSDIVMAGTMDGLELARAIRERNPDLPVILVTGYNDRSENAIREFTLLRKPYTIADLSRAIMRVRAEKQLPSASNIVRLLPPHRGDSPENA
ncbi:MAG TPA: PAS domain S-box protein [Gemmataceae bacterium]|nr:PAS domain S-box protein [Gemmataceae bacterium]